MARRKRYSGKKTQSYRSAAKPEPVQADRGPARTAAAQAVLDMAEKLDQEAAVKKPGGFELKPRAVRRFEKYANMGE